MAETPSAVLREGETVSAFAPAKVNLYLHVTGRRPDGYHLLDMLIVFAGVGDHLRASPADDLSLSVDGPFAAGVPTGEENLIIRAARGLADLTGRQPLAHIHLEKNLPPASGIGGGSADAAATLRALQTLWEVDAPREALHRLALELGADVPMCLEGKAAQASGVGEDLRPLETSPKAWLVLVNPGVPVSTPTVFKARTAGFSPPAPFNTTPRDAADLAARLAERRNDLEAPARSVAPVIGDVIQALQSTDGILLARMSGSGATCFGLYAEREVAEAAAHHIKGREPAWWSVAAPVL